jgi:signal transduction histidine kinase
MNAAVIAPVSNRETEKMEAIGRFASSIVHDFNSVLAAIGVYADMLARQARDAQQKVCAERMVAATERGRNLVGQLLAYARSESAGLTPTDTCASACGAVEMVRGLADADVSVETSIPDAPLVVMADPTQLEQVVTNLCTNAIQAMAKGGALRVSLAPFEASSHARLSHGSIAPGRYALLRVEDEGCGMDEDTLARAFEPFFTTRGKGRGTGLGLAIVSSMVARFGGAIDVRTAPGEGTCFSIYLPLIEAPAEQAARQCAAPGPVMKATGTDGYRRASPRYRSNPAMPCIAMPRRPGDWTIPFSIAPPLARRVPYFDRGLPARE